MTVELEIKFQGEFHYSATVLVYYLPKVVLGFLGIIKSLGWITGIRNSAGSIVDIHSHLADGIERKVNVACI